MHCNQEVQYLPLGMPFLRLQGIDINFQELPNIFLRQFEETECPDFNQIILDKPKKNFYDLIIICVRHRIFFKKSKLLLKKFGKKNCKYYDIKLGGFLN